ncbi:helix-turn-helix domain-containing protein [Providencia sp. Me31A]|uniref:helix-turn-helix domain-containing protein n=1 Tax=Providencia sp. Me31A TaxID=3392637 RepID=UPI003D29D9DA
MINNDLISTIEIEEKTESVFDCQSSVDGISPELQMRKALIDQLRTARLVNNLTQMQVAQRMRTQKQNISRLEKGLFDPKLGTLLKYAEAVGLRITLDYPSEP